MQISLNLQRTLTNAERLPRQHLLKISNKIINYLAKDFLFFMILAHLMLFCGLEECLTLWIAGGLHIVADILIITLRYLRHRQPLQ